MSVLTAHNAIDIQYPVAGQDNNSQGFRDNFGHIFNAFQETDLSLTELSSNAILKGGTTVNDLTGATITNGLYNTLYGVTSSHDVPAGSAVLDINLTSGRLQEIQLHAGENVMKFTNWPIEVSFAEIKLHLVNKSGSDAVIVPISSEAAGNVIYESAYIATNTGERVPITINTDTQLVINAWSYDSGANVYVSVIGFYNAPASE